MADKKPERDEDDIVGDLVPDPGDVRSLRVLTGYLGRSTRKGHLRLYLSASLDSYLEVETTAVVRRQSIPATHAPLGGTILWVKKDAKIHSTHARSVEAQCEFLQGRLAARRHRHPRVPGVVAGGAGPGVFAPAESSLFLCGSNSWASGASTEACLVWTGGPWDFYCTWEPECQ